MRRISVVVADRHPVVLQGLGKWLESQHDFNILACCSEGKSCIEAIRKGAPDVAILSASMPGITGREVLSIVKSEHLATRLIFFTSSDEVRELVMSAGTSGYSIISKDVMPETLVQSLRRVVEGETLLPVLSDRQVAFRKQNSIAQNVLTTLTDREHQIMRLVSEGLSNKEIGRRLQITHGTIKQHLHHIFQKLEISNRTVLAALAISNEDRSIDPEQRPT
jgi:two-component system nitrate/nitrite response regulator NarL